MIISQMKIIGELMREGKSDYEVLVDRYGTLNASHILVAEMDIWNMTSTVKLHLEEFQPSRNYDYGLGFLTGNKTNLAPCLRLGLTDEKKLASSIRKKIILLMSDSEDPVVKQLHDWLDTNHKELASQIYKFTASLDLPKADLPKALVFRFPPALKGKMQYSGEHSAIRNLMVQKEREYSSPQEVRQGTCHACGEKRELRDAFNYGLMTLDQESFSIGFATRDNQGQFRVCNDCYLDCVNGYNIVESRLKFWAYSIKRGTTKVRVYYYMIPQTPDREQLRKAITTIGEAKSAIIDGSRKNLEQEIRLLNARIERSTRDAKRHFESRLKRVTGQYQYLQRTGEQEIDLPEIVGGVYQTGLGMHVFYFTLSDQPGEKPKEVVEHYFISGSHLKELAELFQSIRNDYSLKEIRLWRLRGIVGDKMFLKVLEGLFRQTGIEYREFLKRASETAYDEFKKKAVENPDKSFSLFNTRSFVLFDDLVRRGGLVGG